METFYKLFIDHKDGKIPYSIEVPRIQRDYIQGLNINIKVGFCKQLIDTIESSLNDENSRLNLNFIYGTNKGNIFVPIDGQQRLTTLWLLHLYVMAKLDIKDMPVISYKVREYSENFCNEFIKNVIELVKSDNLDIQGRNWFVRSWKKDRTVQSIIGTFEYFHSILKNKNITYYQSIWCSLSSDNCPIVFSLMNPKIDSVNDDLYLKMNSRGRLLSEYENLKSWLDKKLEDTQYKDANNWRLCTDNEWTSLVWKNRKSVENIDNEQQRLFYNIFIVYLLINKSQAEIVDKHNEESFYELMDYDKNKEGKNIYNVLLTKFNSSNNYSMPLYALNKLNIFDDVLFSQITTYYNILVEFSSHKDDLEELLPYKGNLLYEVCMRKEHTYVDSIYLLSIILYFLRNKYEKDKFCEWMRVVRNVQQNISIDSIEPFNNASKLFIELSEYSYDIYLALSKLQYSDIKTNFATDQVQEEIFKAHLIIDKSDIKKIVHKLEDCPFNYGRIFFPLYCLGVNLKDIGYMYKEDLIDCNELSQIYDVFDSHLSKDDITSKFRRMLFASGNHTFYQYWSSWSYSLDLRKYRAIESTQELARNFSHYKCGISRMEFLKEVIVALKDNSNDEDKTMDYFIKNKISNMPDGWIKSLIQKDGILEKYCTYPHWFGVTKNEKECFLFQNSKRPSDKKQCFKVPTDDC